MVGEKRQNLDDATAGTLKLPLGGANQPRVCPNADLPKRLRAVGPSLRACPTEPTQPRDQDQAHDRGHGGVHAERADPPRGPCPRTGASGATGPRVPTAGTRRSRARRPLAQGRPPRWQLRPRSARQADRAFRARACAAGRGVDVPQGRHHLLGTPPLVCMRPTRPRGLCGGGAGIGLRLLSNPTALRPLG